MCGKCEKVCPTQAVDFLQQPEELILKGKAHGPGDHRLRVDLAFPTSSSTARAAYPTSSTPCRWSGCWPPTAPTTGCSGPRRRQPSRTTSPMCNAPAPGTTAWGLPTARGCAACTPSSRPCCSPAPCPWPTSPSTTWTSGPSAKATSSSIKTPRPWASPLSRPRSPHLDAAEGGNVILHYEDQLGGAPVTTAEHDLVVLSLGMVPGLEPGGHKPGVLRLGQVH